MTTRPFPLIRGLCLSLLCLGVVLLVSGCGGRATVSGKVTYKNVPLKNGSIQFQASDGTIGDALIGSDGTYTARVSPGEAKVAITSYDEAKQAERQKKVKEMREAARGGGRPALNPKDFDMSSADLIPQKYGDFAKSGLTKTIKPGTNKDVDFNLE